MHAERRMNIFIVVSLNEYSSWTMHGARQYGVSRTELGRACAAYAAILCKAERFLSGSPNRCATALTRAYLFSSCWRLAAPRAQPIVSLRFGCGTSFECSLHSTMKRTGTTWRWPELFYRDLRSKRRVSARSEVFTTASECLRQNLFDTIHEYTTARRGYHILRIECISCWRYEPAIREASPASERRFVNVPRVFFGIFADRPRAPTGTWCTV